MEGAVKVLLVDDEADFITMMQFWLRKNGFEADVLCSGEKVVETIRAGAYHIMFLDLKLPDKNGIDILREVRAFAKELPVIIFSAYGTRETLKEATALGISGFFAKEKGFEEAARLISTALRIHKRYSPKQGDADDGS